MYRRKLIGIGASAAVLLGVVLVGVGPATAARPRAISPKTSHSRSAVGVYDFWVNGDTAPQELQINGPGGFTMGVDFAEDEGNWAALGTSVALFVTTNFDSNEVPSRCVLVGTVGKHGLNSEASPGQSSCGLEWWATRSKQGGSTSSGDQSLGKTVDPVGVYDEFSSNGGSGILTVDSGNTFSTSYQDTGNWISLNKAFAFGVVSSVEGDTGCVYLGTLNAKGINSKAKEGPTQCRTTVDHWYAKRLKKQ
jgi:hypothetical protein